MEKFEEALSLVNKLAIELKGKVGKASETEKINDKKSDELSGRETGVSEKETDLNQREAKVQGIESIVQLKEDAITLRKTGEKSIAEAEGIKEANALANQTEKDINLAEKKRLETENNKLIDNNKLLAIGWDQLRKKEKTYKDEISALIRKKLG